MEHCWACCVGPLLVLGVVLVLTDRLDLLLSSLGLPVASGMSSPGMTTVGSLFVPSSGSGRKATYKMPLHSSLSASFILRTSVTQLAGDALGFIFGVGYIAFLLAFLNLLSLISWPKSLSMLLVICDIKISSCISFLNILSLSPDSCASLCLRNTLHTLQIGLCSGLVYLKVCDMTDTCP